MLSQVKKEKTMNIQRDLSLYNRYAKEQNASLGMPGTVFISWLKRVKRTRRQRVRQPNLTKNEMAKEVSHHSIWVKITCNDGSNC